MLIKEEDILSKINLLYGKNIFLINDTHPLPGQKVKNQMLAETLKIISKKGRKGFYEDTAQKIVKFLNEIGGLHSLEDFYNYSGDFVEPINTINRTLPRSVACMGIIISAPMLYITF